MSICNRAILAAALLLMSSVARSDGIYNPGVGGWGFQDGINGPGTPPVPQPTGDVLMVDGTSLILQTDGASFVCRAGGC